MTILKKGMKGEAVKALQKCLNEALKPSPPINVDGDFGLITENAVKQFQANAGIAVDGVVGPNTNAHLLSVRQDHDVSPITSPQSLLADIAAKYIGVRETGDNQAGTSKILQEIFAADDLRLTSTTTDGYPWCAAFVSYCTQQLIKQSASFFGITAPREASVSRFLNTWAEAQKCIIFDAKSELYQPCKGDIVVFTFSHIGIVESVHGNAFESIEGNTNSSGSREGVEVARKNRSLRIARAFIRLPVKHAVMHESPVRER